MEVGTMAAGAEELAKLGPKARFVDALPSFAEMLHSGSTKFGDDISSTFYCGDDAQAKEVVAGLLRETGVEPVDVGPLRNARYLEPAMMLLVQMSYRLRMGMVGFKLLRKKQEGPIRIARSMRRVSDSVVILQRRCGV